MLNKNAFALACLVLITVSALAKGGAFEPDEIVGVDTVEVVVEVPLRVDTVYVAAVGDCGTLHLDDGRRLAATHADRGRGWGTIERFDSMQERWRRYRSCSGEIVHLDGRPRGYAFAR
jgi:hypothetical protein